MNKHTSRNPVPAPSPFRSALKYALIYAVAATAWIVISDEFVLQLAENNIDVSQLQTYKGLVFVMLTTLLLFGLLYLQFDRIYASLERLQDLEKTLKTEQDRYERMTKYSGLGVGFYAADGRLQYFNEVSLKNLGGQLSDYVGRQVSDIFDADTAKRVHERFNALNTKRLPQVFEDKVSLGNSEKWFRSHYSAIRNEQDEITGIQIVSDDITAQKEIEKQLQFQAQLLQAVQQAVIATDLTGQIVYWNDFAEQMYGWSASEVAGKPINEITVPDISRAEAEQIMSQVAEEGVWSGEFTVTHRDGHAFPALVTNSHYYDEGGNTAGIIGLSKDISERKAQENALRAANDYLNAMFEASPAAIVVIDEDSNVKQWNPTAEALFGWTAEEVIDERIPLIPDEKWDEFVLNVERLEATGGETDRHVIRQRKDGTLIDLSLSTTSFTNTHHETRLMAVYVDISDRLKLTRELEKTKVLLERVFASLTEVVLVINPDDRTVVTCNPAIENIFGYSREDVIGENTAFLHSSPENYIRFGEHSGPILEKQGVFATEYQMRHKDGTLLETEHTVTLLVPEAGLQGGVVSVIRDITKEKRTLRQIQQKEQRYRNLFENAPVAIWHQDFSDVKQYLQEIGIKDKEELKQYLKTHPIVFKEFASRVNSQEVNQTTVSLYGAETKQQLIERFEETIRLEDEQTRSVQIESMLAIASNQQRFEGEFVNWNLQGERLYMFIRWIVLPGSEETYEDVLVIGLDITARKQMELQLREEFRKQKELTMRANMLQKSAEALVHSTQLHNGLQESEKHLAAISDHSALAVFQVQKNQLVPMIIHDGNDESPDDFNNAIQYKNYPVLHAALTIGHSIRLDVIEDDNRLRSAFSLHDDLSDWIAIPLSSRDVILGLLCVSMQHRAFSEKDLKILKTYSYQIASALDNSQAHLELQESYERLKNIQQKTIRTARLAAIGELAAGVAHQINNPLMTVIADSHLLLKRIEQDQIAQESAEAISRAAHRAGNIVQRLLDFSRTSPGQMAMLDINQSLRSAIELIRPQIEPPYAELKLNFNENIPDIYGSEDHLQDVWMNILLNARDAVREVESGIIRVSTDFSIRTEQIVVTIEDNGGGIDEHAIENIFDPFFTTKEQGTGLGLSIAFDIIQQHHGMLDVEQIVGGGARFIVKLPA